MQKTFTIKIYELNGTYIKTLASGESGAVMGGLSWNDQINGGQGEMSLDLNLPFDDFEEVSTVDCAKMVKVFESDDNNQARLIYTGIVTSYDPYFDESSEGVRLNCQGLGAMLGLACYKNGASYDVTHTSQDPGDIVRAIIAHFNTKYAGAWISSAGVQNTGTPVSVVMSDLTWLEAIQKALELAGAGWYFHVGPDGNVTFAQKPATATHRFTIGAEATSGHALISSEDMVNQYQLRPGSPGAAGNYSDTPSQALYGLREPKPESDTSFSDATTRDRKGNAKVADLKDKKATGEIVIVSSYDIESIKPGDTATMLNVRGTNPYPTNLQITGVSYTPERAILTFGKTAATLAAQITKTIKATT